MKGSPRRGCMDMPKPSTC